MPAPLPPQQRIIRNSAINLETGCWEWTGARHKRGDGALGVHYRKKLAHRVSYEDFVGPIPDGLEIDHLCFNPSCVNPAHLEPVTRAENMRRAGKAGLQSWRARTTHCKYGHEYTPENTNITPQGWRECRTCGRLKMRALRATARASRPPKPDACRRGHAFTPENTRLRRRADRAERICIECDRARKRAHANRKRTL